MSDKSTCLYRHNCTKHTLLFTNSSNELKKFKSKSKYQIQQATNPMKTFTRSSWSSLIQPKKNSSLGFAAISFICIDYLRHASPSLHQKVQPLLWGVLALAAIVRIPSYKHWSLEFRSAIPFIASMFLMLFTLLLEAMAVRFTTAVLGLSWHRYDFDLLCISRSWLLLELDLDLTLLHYLDCVYIWE